MNVASNDNYLLINSYLAFCFLFFFYDNVIAIRRSLKETTKYLTGFFKLLKTGQNNYITQFYCVTSRTSHQFTVRMITVRFWLLKVSGRNSCDGEEGWKVLAMKQL